jgi:FtsP/CotA-like multicopper oxidase with cupredoxin domain
VLAITLTATPAEVDIHAAKPAKTYTYDGVIPGHTWEIRPGQTLQVDLVNELPVSPDEGHTIVVDRPHKWTTTNLHVHGMHVSPEGNGDDVFVAIEPGATHHYEIEVPANHPGGIFWYHPHHHGGVAQQVRGGMSGMIVVRGDIDEVPEVAAAKEQVMVIGGLQLSDQFALEEPIPDPSLHEAFWPRDQIVYPINGVLNPKITMHPGEVQRWRILNSEEGKFYNLTLDGLDIRVLAWDGLTLAAPEQVPNLFLSAGNRVEVLVKALVAGTHQLILTPSSSQLPGTQGVPDRTTTTLAGPLPEEGVGFPIATVVVEGTGPDMALPTTLPAWDPEILPIARRRTVTYTVERDPDDDSLTFADFGVDGHGFDPNAPAYQVKLNTAEEWTLVNGVDQKLPEHAHGFHIHVNPFKVTKINGTTLDKPMWRDTFILTGKNGDSFTFESNFVDFTGKYVDHCHILSHEDLGMMEIIEVVP